MRRAMFVRGLLLTLCVATAIAGTDSGSVRQTRASAGAAAAAPPRLTVHADRRYLVGPDGQPFLYLSDTAWELFHRPNREQVRAYLELRAKQRFTVIHAVALAEVQGISDPNAYGDLPLVDKDLARPAVTPGSNPKN